MIDWVAKELELLRTFWPDLEYVEEGHWVLKGNYQFPLGWSLEHGDVAIRIPADLPAEQPYGFWVRGGISPASGGVTGSYVFPAEEVIPFAPTESWGRFSWALQDNAWKPGAMPGAGTGLVQFAMSINRRLQEFE
jgi:hypothetical protein